MFVKELILLNSPFKLRKDLETNKYSLVRNNKEWFYDAEALDLAQQIIRALGIKYERYMINQQKSYEEFIS